MALEQGKGLDGTILVVDDEESIRFILKRMLEYLGCSVLLAENGLRALEIYDSLWERIDLIILDISMPKMNGEMVIERVLAMNPVARILVSSGYSRGDRDSPVLGRATGFLEKPYTIDQLQKAIRRCLP